VQRAWHRIYPVIFVWQFRELFEECSTRDRVHDFCGNCYGGAWIDRHDEKRKSASCFGNQVIQSSGLIDIPCSRTKLLYVHEIHSDSREQYEEIMARIRRDWDIEMIEVSKNAIS
jgi:hypothetical protein